MPIQFLNTNGRGGFTLKNNSGAGRFSMSIANTNDTDAQAFFARVTAAGGTLSGTEQTAITNLVASLKANNLWDSMQTIYPMVGASAAACAQNLKSSSYTGTFSGGWTFASTGAKPNGTNAYMNTTLDISALTQTNSHASYYSRDLNDVSGNPTCIGGYGNSSYTTSVDLYIKRPLPGNKGGGQLGSFSTSVINFTETDARKFAILSRTSATSLKYYTTGVLRATDTVSDTTGFGSVTAFIGAGNYITGVAQNFSSLECAFASIGNGLSDTDAANFYTAVQAFQTSLSRQV